MLMMGKEGDHMHTIKTETPTVNARRSSTESTVPGIVPATIVDDTRSGSRVADALASIGDWCLSADVIRAVYHSDVSIDGVWAALADAADLDVSDLATTEAH